MNEVLCYAKRVPASHGTQCLPWSVVRNQVGLERPPAGWTLQSEVDTHRNYKSLSIHTHTHIIEVQQVTHYIIYTETHDSFGGSYVVRLSFEVIIPCGKN